MTVVQIINFFGGLAMFIYGMNMMTENIQNLIGSEMRRILKVLTDTPVKGVLVGMTVTALIQSSSATTVMLIGLVNTGILNLSQAVGVIMGANIGTTLTAQLIAFNVGEYAYGALIIGVFLLLVRKSRTMERWGHFVIGLGLIFIGLSVMSKSAIPLRESEVARDVIMRLSSNPFLGVLTGTIFTMMIQSSAASVGIVIVLTSGGLIPFESAIYLILGDNIGTTITAWLASIGSNHTARRVAMVHTLFNVIGTFVFGFLTYKGIYPIIINRLTPGDVSLGENIARHVANSHSFFNIFNTLFLLPFAGILAKIASFIVKEDKSEPISLGEPRHLNYHMISNSELAINQALREMREMLRLVRLGLSVSYEAFKDKNYKKQIRVSKIEQAIDNLQREITLYLVAINERTNAESVARKIPALLHTVNDIEKLGDYVEEVNRILNYQVPMQKQPLSEEHIAMIDALQDKLCFMLDLCISYLKEYNEDSSYKIIEMEGRIKEQHRYLRNRILTEIQNGECDAAGGLNTIDYLDQAEVIADKMKNLVKAGSHSFVYPNMVARPIYEPEDEL